MSSNLQFASTPSSARAVLSDADLVQAARRGDKWAFVEIVARYQCMVCGVALGILGDFAASEDAGQEAFLTAWRKIRELREPDRLKPWLAQIARNAALGQMRRDRGKAPLDEDELIPDESVPPDEAAAIQEETALVRALLASLPETYRLPLVLFYREGQSIRATAVTLQISEDAVKQRLARGREMLREQIAGKLEKALVRTAPTAVFTMTVAAAIGALAAPAAVAGAAFSAATVSGAASTAGSSSSLLTAMSTSKAFLVATVLVASVSLPVGYPLRPSPAVASSTVSKTVHEVGHEREKQASAIPDSAFLAEWRALHERYGTNAEAMPRLYQAISDFKDRFRRQAFRAALISEWVQLDPTGGLPFFLAKGRDEVQRRQFFEEWLARDPRGAVDGLLAGDPGWAAMARECLKAIARQAPERVPEIASRLPNPESFWDREVQDAFVILGERDLASGRQAAESTTGPNREQALQGIAQVWGQRDFDATLNWARNLPEGTDRDEVVRAALIGKASVDPEGALNSTGLVPPGGRYAHAATTTGARVLQQTASADFETTAGWIAAHPGALSRDDLEGLSRTVTERLNADPVGFLNARVADGSLLGVVPAVESALLNSAGGQRSAVWDWLKVQPETEATRSLKQEVLQATGFQEPGLALKIVAELPATPEGDKQVQELARCLLNGGNALTRFDSLYQDSPERLRQALLTGGFQSLSGRTLDDPQKWLARLPSVPESDRPAMTESLARAWAQQNPEEALAWASALPPGNAQTSALAAISSGWAVQDPQSAAAWLSSLPPGASKDRGAEAFATAVAQTYPQESWQWVTGISDQTVQLHAANEVLKVVGARDPSTARQWIEAGPFSAENKVQLQAVVDRALAGGRL